MNRSEMALIRKEIVAGEPEHILLWNDGNVRGSIQGVNPRQEPAQFPNTNDQVNRRLILLVLLELV